MYKEIPVVIVAAMSREKRVIGQNNDLLWHIPADMKRFRTLTLGHPVVMGRKTFESILAIIGKPLPNRPNIVITRNTDYTHPAENVEVVASLEDGLEKAAAHNPTEIHIGGGAEIYTVALPYVDRLHLTFVDDEPAGDTFFPDFTNEFKISKSLGKQTHEDLVYEWVDFVRK